MIIALEFVKRVLEFVYIGTSTVLSVEYKSKSPTRLTACSNKI